MDTEQIDDYKAAKPFVRSAIALLVYLVRGASGVESYDVADFFLDELEKNIGIKS